MPEMKIARFRLPDSSTAAELDKLCAGIADRERPGKILITACHAQEGAGYVAMNMLRAVGELGMRTVLVEADLNRPQLRDVFDIHVQNVEEIRYAGLGGYLSGQCSLDDILGKTGHPKADLILAGEPVGHSLRLLSSERFRKLLGELAERYDAVLVLAPPLENAADAIRIAPLCDRVLLTVRSGCVRSSELIRAVEQMKRSGGHVAGTVLCRFEERRRNCFYSMVSKLKKRL